LKSRAARRGLRAAVCGAAWLALGPAAVRAAATPARAAEARRGVLLELFTSQGCSSCPPADRLLAKLGEQSELEVVPLAYHIDSWNSLGWVDPFSAPSWTERHARYAARFGVLQATPQAIVDGRAALTGPDEARWHAALAEAAARPGAAIRLRLAPASGSVRVEADVALPGALAGRKLDLMLALFEVGLVTPVARGENGGRELRTEFVVRSLTRAGRLPRRGETASEGASLALDRAWRRAGLGVAAFVQDPVTLEVVGAAAARLGG
jgi:hypothetical protein